MSARDPAREMPLRHFRPGDESFRFASDIFDTNELAGYFLSSCNQLFSGDSATLHLLNEAGDLETILEVRGALRICGDQLHKSKLPLPIWQQMRRGEACIIEEDGRMLHLAIPLGDSLSGALTLRAGRPLYNREEIGSLLYEVRRFGEDLYRQRLFHRAAVERETGLGNLLLLQRDMAQLFAMRRIGRHGVRLLLIQLGEKLPEFDEQLALDGYRRTLRQSFAQFDGATHYRPAADLLALLCLNSQPTAESGAAVPAELVAALRELQNGLARRLHAGSAISDESVSSAAEWYTRGRDALGEARRAGTLLLQL